MSTKEEPRPERKQTDESLAVERERADHALAEKEAAREQTADVVVERARDEADEVLTNARAKADAKLHAPASPEQTQSVVAEERAQEDELLREERALADETLRRQRAASLARLLPIERDKTDLYLLTERARADDALANRDDFLGMVSHDLRDLLSAIVGNAAMILHATSDTEEGSPVHVSAQRIQRSAARMTRLIGDLVDIASIDAGKLAIAPTVIDAASMIAEALETWTAPAAARGVVLQSSAQGSPTLLGDSERLLQVIGNLVTNAVKFSAHGDAIVLGLEDLGKEVRFSVQDSGVGIAGEALEAVFERFWQASEGQHRGLGLGLYISRCLVEAHGGKIWVESEPGAGSTFFFTVPLAR
ncbi:MAG: HAMP domain-containing histidine kinase [Myxococcota bacterium]|nr:HAMP domain-containing histidine kinase [Myxococcota bacterium]